MIIHLVRAPFILSSRCFHFSHYSKMHWVLANVITDPNSLYLLFIIATGHLRMYLFRRIRYKFMSSHRAYVMVCSIIWLCRITSSPRFKYLVHLLSRSLSLKRKKNTKQKVPVKTKSICQNITHQHTAHISRYIHKQNYTVWQNTARVCVRYCCYGHRKEAPYIQHVSSPRTGFQLPYSLSCSFFYFAENRKYNVQMYLFVFRFGFLIRAPSVAQE